MFGRLNDALLTAADVLAPPPTKLQSFEYHWKHVKNFYAANAALPKVHIDNTNLPAHLEEMLKLLIDEERDKNDVQDAAMASMCAPTTKLTMKRECFDFVLNNRPFDLLTDICITDSPPGASVCILTWIRRFLSCMNNPRLGHKSIIQPVQKLITYCSNAAGCASPYEQDEIVYLLTVAGVIRKEPLLLHLFLPAHEHSLAVTALNPSLGMKTPVKNTLFEHAKLEASIRRISLVHDETKDYENAAQMAKNEQTKSTIDTADERSSSSSIDNCNNSKCDCQECDSFVLFDTIVRYFESADSVVVVRACEAALILISLPTISTHCMAQTVSFGRFCKYLSEKLAFLCQDIPDDMDNGDIEDCVSSWGLLPRDADAPYFIGRPQLMEFLCWLDYCNCLAKECNVPGIVCRLAENIRVDMFEMSIEPMITVLDINAAGFMLVLTAKIIRQIDSKEMRDEIAVWLVGLDTVVDRSDAGGDENVLKTDCLLNIIVENAQDNLDILLPTLQFIEALLDNANERILHNMIFRYIETRGYYDAAASSTVQTWSDEEDEREKKRSNAAEPMKSTTLKPNNILKVINNFLLLLPRQIISDSIGTCYEEYVQDANRHYKNWIAKTAKFNWPIEAVSHSKDLEEEIVAFKRLTSSASSSNPKLQSCDSGIAEEQFYEGPLLRMLFMHVRNMAKHPYELNIAVIAILSKLSFLPHPYLHEILLNPEIPVARGTNTLWSNMQILSRHLLLEIPRIEGFQKRITVTAKRLLINPPVMSEVYEESDALFESLVALEEFCKELAAIAFVKYHHATE